MTDFIESIASALEETNTSEICILVPWDEFSAIQEHLVDDIDIVAEAKFGIITEERASEWGMTSFIHGGVTFHVSPLKR